MELSRRQLLAALGGSAAAAGGYLLTRDGDSCPAMRKPNWTVGGDRWSRPVPSPNGLLVSEGFALTGGSELNRVANVEYGEIRWAYTIGGDGGGVPYADGDLVAVGTGSDHVHAFDQPSGHLRWTYDAGGNEEYGGGAWGQPARTDGAILVAVSHSDQPDPDPGDREAYTHRLLALEAADGSVRWESGIDDVAFVGPVVHESTVVVATRAGGVHGVALDSGERRWRESAPGDVWAPLVHDEDRASVYVADTAGAVTAFDPASGEQRWQRSLDAGVGAVAMAGSDLFVGTENGRVRSLRATDGETQWTESLGTPVGAVDVHEDTVAVFDHSGVVSLLAAGSGHVGTRFSVTESRGSECGWNPDGEWANGLLYDGFDATVSGRWSLGNFDADAE